MYKQQYCVRVNYTLVGGHMQSSELKTLIFIEHSKLFYNCKDFNTYVRTRDATIYRHIVIH